jgi:hypothetical protein
LKIIFDNDLALRDIDNENEKAKERKNKETKVCKRTIAINYFILFFNILISIIAMLSFILRDELINLIDGLIWITGLFAISTCIICGMTIANTKRLLQNVKVEPHYSALAKYYSATQNKLFKEQKVKFEDAGCPRLIITTINCEDIVVKENIFLSDFEVFNKAYIKDVEVNLVDKKIYLPCKIDD